VVNLPQSKAPKIAIRTPQRLKHDQPSSTSGERDDKVCVGRSAAGEARQGRGCCLLRSAVPLVNAEQGTVSWFAIQEGASRFAIFDTFDDEAGREAHLSGKVAAALMEKVKAGDLFEGTPEIYKLDILADKLAK
jgi:quinol monooxygenase YgiN